jgi:CCR4-NOT transcriptional complex subunit CAF120
MMLRWLFPVFDTFALYGRPGRLIADTADPNSLMFAMPKHRRYGYLEILDVTGLILEQGSANWRESEWRKRMKDLTKKRMTAIENGSRTNSRYSSRRSTRNSFGPSRSRIQFDDAASIRSSPSVTWGPAAPADPSFGGLPRTDSAPPGGNSFTPPRASSNPHQRSVSETNGVDRFQNQNSGSNYDGAYEPAPTPPPHNIGIASGREAPGLRYMKEMASTPERVSSEDEQARITPVRELQELQATTSPEPVATPPAFSHAPGSMPSVKRDFISIGRRWRCGCCIPCK